MEAKVNADGWAKQILIASLPPEPQAGMQMASVTSTVAARPYKDVILDLGRADILRRATVRALMEMQRVLVRHGARLVLFNLGPMALSTFSSCKMDKVLHVANKGEVILAPPLKPGAEGTLILSSNRPGIRRERRKCMRLNLAVSLRIGTLVWQLSADGSPLNKPHLSQHGFLVDLSEAGVQVAVEGELMLPLERGSKVGLKCTDPDLAGSFTFEARVGAVVPAADGGSVCLGLEFCNMDANPTARNALRRLCDYQTRYYEATECIE